MARRPYHKWTDEQEQFIRDIAPNSSKSEIQEKVNLKFNLDLNSSQVANFRKVKGILAGKNPVGRHIWSEEQIDFMLANYKGRSNEDLTDMVNTEFGLNLEVQKILAFKNYRSLASGLSGQFTSDGAHSRKGIRPASYLPIGSERVNVDGYIEVKVGAPSTWALKHRTVWEMHNGPIPAGMAIMFGDGNRSNIDIDNLICVSNAQLAVLNGNKLIQNDADLTRVAINLVDLKLKIGEVERNA